MIKAGVITVSDKGSRGEREDKSGQVLKDLVESLDAEVIAHRLIPDEEDLIKEELIRMCDELGADLVITTGGTGLGPRDVTPDATLKVLDRQVPGLSEAIRAEGFKKTPHSLLSRAVAGVRGKSLIVNLPGSPRAVEESMNTILPALPHAVEVIRGEAAECGG